MSSGAAPRRSRTCTRRARGAYDDGTPRSKHVITNLLIEVDAERGTGTCRSYFTVFQQTDTLALQPIVAGRYRDEFTRVDHVWRFTRREMIVDLTGDLSQHLLFAAHLTSSAIHAAQTAISGQPTVNRQRDSLRLRPQYRGSTHSESTREIQCGFDGGEVRS